MFTVTVPQRHPHLPVSLDHLQALNEAHMSFASAVLMYGCYLGTDVNLARFTDSHGIEDAFVDEVVHGTLVAAAGFTEQWTEATRAAWLDHYEAASRFMGLAVLRVPVFDQGHYYLSGAYMGTGGDPRAVLALDRIPPVTEPMETRIKWGMRELGLDPADEPKWMLATAEDGFNATPAFGRIADHTPTDD